LAGVTGTDWLAWHNAYEKEGSDLSLRLVEVQRQVRAALDAAPPGPVRVLSLCAGQGRDLLEVLPDHPRRTDVSAVLVELDPRNVATARAADADGVEVRQADAALVDGYADAAPADVLMLCGIFGNVSAADIEWTVYGAGSLTAQGGTVIWTRHREPPDLVPRICEWFEEAGFAPVWVSPVDAPYGIGVHRRTVPTAPLASDTRLFTFTR
jgi:hypothetical protein